MADVFISYSSADKAHAQLLDELLERAGFTVWWDSHLLAGQRFQESIKQELAQAGAVLVVWSPTSVSSAWVYSEARRGNERGVLLQVRQRGVTIDDLPAPFDAFHCPFIDETDAITKAVASVVGKTPAEVPVGVPGLPSGTVTLLFSEVESSTQMVHGLGEAWAGVVDRQRDICRIAWAAQGGHELRTEADSSFVVFATAEAAVSAALDAQRAIGQEDWPEEAPVRVRIGIHTGAPLRRADGYVGTDVHRAARVAGSAHGGQILVSEATARLAESSLPEGVRLVDLGEHQLKDIPTKMRLLQVNAPGLVTTFPPVRSLGAAGSLPTHLVGVVGRDEELAELGDLLAGGARLVTLTGPGGTGKTRLATALAADVADRFPDGVFVVHLAGVMTATGMWSAVAQMLDVPADGQVPPGFFTYVAHKRVLLVLDNLEQIEDSDHMVRKLLESAGHVVVVATSRRPLHVTGEHEYAVSPLEPQAAQELFAQHAARVRRGFALTPDNSADVAKICGALDGLPLAIELTAARCKLLSPKAILARIDQSLDVTSTDRSRETRQATIRGAIAWSYHLLDQVHRSVLDHLGVFVGGASFEAIEAVVTPQVLGGRDLADVLFGLVDASLVTVTDAEDGEPRFGLLETIRRFALDRLEASGQRDAAVARHAQYFYDYARDLYEWGIGEFAKARRGLLGDLSNISAMVERRAPGVTHAQAYPDPVPWRHVVALVASVAIICRRYADAEAWCRLALAGEESDDDQIGRLAVNAVLGRKLQQWGEVEEGLHLCAGMWTDLEQIEEDPSSSLPPWVHPTRITADVADRAASMLAGRGEFTQAGIWRDRLAAVDDQLDGYEAGLLSRLDLWIAYEKGDFVAAHELVLEVARRSRAAGLRTSFMQNVIADFDLQVGNLAACQRRLAEASEAIIADGDPESIVCSSETMAASVGPDHPLLCARVYGCTSVTRAVEGLGNDEYGVAEDERVLAGVRPLVDPAEWEAAWKRGQGENIVDLFREMAALPIPAEDSGPQD